MVTVQDLRQKLEELLRAGDSYPFLTVVEEYLAVAPDDDPMRAAAMGLLVQKGLLSVAAELGRACPAHTPNGAELRRAAEQLEKAQTDRIDIASTESRFAANLATLRGRAGRYAELADEIERVWREECGGITLHRANDGNVLARATATNGLRLWVPAALDFVNQAEVLQGQASWKGKMTLPFLAEGVGMGWLIPGLHAASRETYLTYSPAIHVVERNVRALAVVLRLHDWREVLTDERVYLFCGPTAWEQWRELMRSDVLASPPGHVSVLPAWPGSPPSEAASMCEQAVRDCEQACEPVARELEEIYGPLDRAYWAKRYARAGGDDPLRILAVTCRFSTFLQHSTRDLLAAFERAGARTRLLIEPHDHALVSRKMFLDAFAEYRPDAVVLLDHHRQEMANRYPRNVPFICWIQDELTCLFEPGVGARMHEFDFTIGYGRTRAVLKCGYPPERFMPCRLAVDLEKFSPRPGDVEDPSLRCDVAYVSNHSETPEAMHARLRSGAGHPQVQALMDAFFDGTRELMRSPRFNAGYDLGGLLRQAEERSGIMVRDEALRDRLMSVYVRPLADRTLRHATLAWIADWAESTGRVVHLYGRGWENHPRFGRYARGVAEHGWHLGRIARHAGINLHMGTSLALHQRVLETVGAGGFVMVRWNPLDFEPPAYESFRRWLIEHEVCEPTRIPIDELPADWVEGRRRRDALLGRQTPDVIAITREYLLERDPRKQDERCFDFSEVAFPGFERITFDGPASFGERAEHFLSHPDEREAIAARMQARVRELFTYDALVERLLAFVGKGLG